MSVIVLWPALAHAKRHPQFEPMLDLSVVTEVGFVPGSDPYGIFFGISPKAALW